MTRPEGSICSDCATLQGLTKKDKVCGVWPGKCDFCGEMKGLTDAVHDWNHPSDKPISLLDVLMMREILKVGEEG